MLTTMSISANDYVMTPDGKYVKGTSYMMTPDGSYVSGDHDYVMTPDGKYVPVDDEPSILPFNELDIDVDLELLNL